MYDDERPVWMYVAVAIIIFIIIAVISIIIITYQPRPEPTIFDTLTKGYTKIPLELIP
jgi:hypothetical protein